MIKFITIVVLLATGLQCRVIPDDVPAPISPEERSIDKSDISPEERSVDKSDISPEERSVDKSDSSPEERTVDKSDTSPEERTVDKSEDRASNAASSKSAQEYSKEATIEKIGKSDTAKATAKRSAAESGSSERHERSADGNRKEGKMQETRSANIGDEKAAARASNLEKSEESIRSGAQNGECGKCTRILRNSKENNNDAAQARSDKLDAPSELKSGNIRSETAERDDASHINIKESRRAPEEGNIETPSLRSGSEEHSKTGSIENENSKTVSVESKSASREPQLRTANQENERSSMDAEDDAKAALLSDVGVEELVKSDLDALTEISPGISLRIFHQKPRLREDIPDSPVTAADTRMAPREGATSSPTGLQVNSFGNNEPGQSEYPYSPLENSNTDILRMLPSLSNLLARNMPTGNPFTTPQNNNEKFTSLSPLDPNKQFKLLPTLPPLDRNEGFRPLPPLPPLEPMRPFKLLPPLRTLEIMKPFEPLPPLRPMELSRQFEPERFLPPLDHFGSFKPLPPLRPLTMNRPFELLPPLPPFEPNGLFKSMPLRPLERSERNEPLPLQDPTSLIKSLQQQLQQLQNSSRNLFPTFPLQSFITRTPSPMFNPSPNSFSMSRQAVPEPSSQMSDGLSRTWHAALLTPVSAVSISRTVDFQ